jgi:hypothetical protein
VKNKDRQDAITTFKALLARAASDEQLMKNLNDLDKILAGCDMANDDAISDSERSKLPYSSDPLVCDNIWN